MRRRQARRSGRGIGSYLPLFVTVAILLSWHFFRIGMFLSLSAVCAPLEEFWVLPNGHRWPLFGSFALVFLLLMAWNVLVWFDARGWVDRALVVANGLALVSITFSLLGLLGLVQLEHYKRSGGYATWNRTPPEFFADITCEVADSYLGTWEVESEDAPFLGQTFPFSSIELRRDLTFSGSRGRFVDPVPGRWEPSGTNHWGAAGWIVSEEVYGIWNFQLGEEGSRLTLTTPEQMEIPVSRVVLVRR